jgi:hypothetical protein
LNKRVEVEVFGVVPFCKRCDAIWKNVEKAASALKSESIDVIVKKSDILSKDVISRYGPLMSPALFVNGKIRVMGNVPDARKIETFLRESAE